jgi:hypothetical protein
MRQILAPIVGIIAGGLVVAAIESVGHAMYPVPALDWTDMAQVRAAIAALPVGAFVFPVVAWWLGTLAGAVVAIRVARVRPWLHAGLVGVVLLAATIGNLVSIPHPWWVAVTGPLGVAVATWAAVALTGTRDPEPGTR